MITGLRFNGVNKFNELRSVKQPLERQWSLSRPSGAFKSSRASLGSDTGCPHRVLAVHKTLAARPVHNLGDGRLVVPLLTPGADGIPFAVALELHRRDYPGRCTDPSLPYRGSSFQLHYILQGSAELVQSGVKVGEVHAGDSVLMPSGTAQCQIGDCCDGDRDQSEWHLAALTLVLGVCPTNITSPGDNVSNAATMDVDCSVAQQVADGWHQAPVVGCFNKLTVAELLACAQAAAHAAVLSQQHVPQAAVDRRTKSNHGSSSSSSDSSSSSRSRSSSNGSSRGKQSGNTKPAASFDQSVPRNGASSQGDQFTGNSAEGRRLSSAGTSKATASRSWRGGPAALTSLLQHIWKQQAERHLEALTQQPAPLQVQRKRLKELQAFTLPGQSNRLALVFNPLDDIGVPFTFGLEIFERNHKTPPHVHKCAHELFFILSGSGTAFCDGHRFDIAPGDAVVFPPTSVHGIDNGSSDRLFCLELMLPNEMFAEMVRKGIFSGALSAEDLCTLAAEECGYIKN